MCITNPSPFTNYPAMLKILSPRPILQPWGIAFIRIITGLFLVYHGHEVFDAATMKGYGDWDMFKINTNPLLIPYIGKSAELVAGIFLTLGFLTRVACVIITGTFIYITFFVGQGKFWYDDQHPFMFALMGVLFFFTGPGALSLDGVLFK